MKKLVVANWKMKLGPSKALEVSLKLRDASAGAGLGCEVVIAPDFVSLSEVGATLKGSSFALGAQDCFWEHEGAFTGEVSPDHLKELGCTYCIVGHSERREHVGETDLMIHRKVSALLSIGLIPIVCVGENFEERQQGQKEYVILRQVTKALEGIELKSTDKVVIAYEPVWVIGSGQAIDPEEAEHTHKAILQAVINLFDTEVARTQFRIVYGGSVDKDTIQGFLKQPSIAGVLVGSASIDPDHLMSLIHRASSL